MSEKVFRQSEEKDIDMENEMLEDLPDDQNPAALQDLEFLIEGLPEEKRNEFRTLFLQIEQNSSWQGPLPPPDKLKEYNEAIPDCAERILRMAENLSDHRIALQKQVIPELQKQSRNGQYFALIIALAFLIVSGLLIWQGHEVSGTILGSVDLVALVGVFIYGKPGQIRGPF